MRVDAAAMYARGVQTLLDVLATGRSHEARGALAHVLVSQGRALGAVAARLRRAVVLQLAVQT